MPHTLFVLENLSVDPQRSSTYSKLFCV